MRTKIVAGNWKMNKSLDEARSLAAEIAGSELPYGVQLILSPPFPYLVPVKDSVGINNAIGIAAQNCSSEEKGAYTGEVSASMIKSCGAGYVIIGHSERRAYFREDSAMLKKKIAMALSNDLMPVYCVGETLDERQSDRAFDVVKQQLSEVLEGLDKDSFRKLIIAYEPVWAIGTGHTATSAQAQEMHAFIRKTLEGLFGDAAHNTSLLYGGSCNAQNAPEIFSCADVDGGLIGGASLEAKSFIAIANAFPSR